jgi:hypothetical protein
MSKISFAKPGTTSLVPPTVPTPTKSANPAPAVTAPPPPAVVPTPPATAPVPTPPAPPVVPPAPPAVAPNTNQTAPAGPLPNPVPTSAALAPVGPTVSVDGQAIPSAADGTAPYVAPPPAAFYENEESGFDAKDLVLPRLVVVQKVGELSTVFPPGSILLGGNLTLVPAPTDMNPGGSLRLCFVGLQPTTFSEKVAGGLGGRYCRTKEEVVKLGGTTDWNEHQALKKPLFQSVCVSLVFIEQPAGVDAAQFPYACEGKNYQLALYTMKGIAYTNAARHVKSAIKIGWLREAGVTSAGFWTLQAQLKKYGTNYAYTPVLKPAEKTTEDFRAALRELTGVGGK